MAQSTNLGYPRIGKNRELKRVIERYWGGKATSNEVETVGREIRRAAFERSICRARLDSVQRLHPL
jgi:5-methyltetrahydropteroyltriglutamate--homocysteine methyltransferase